MKEEIGHFTWLTAMVVILYDSSELSLNLGQYGCGMIFRFEAALIVLLFLMEKGENTGNNP